MNKAIATLFSILLMSCAFSTHQVHVSDFDTPYRSIKRGKLIKASTEQFVILSLVDEVDFVDQAYRMLQAKCPKGVISGITTEHSTALGFFSWTNKLTMQGLCFKS